jgi:alpha/beta superfamily hydrolase
VTVEGLTEYATSIDAHIEVLQGSDHFFYFREERVAAAVADGLTTEE